MINYPDSSDSTVVQHHLHDCI